MNRKLFLIFFKIGLFTLGGGPAMIPIVQNEVVDSKKLIDEQDFLDSVAFASGLPGAIIVNLSIFVGDRINGIGGALASASGAILPAYLAIVVLASIFDRIAGSETIQAIFMGIRPTVIILIGISLYNIVKKTDYKGLSIVFGILALIALAAFDLSAFTILSCAGLLGLVIYSTGRYRHVD
ncbi:MAG: chromate transporter [Peptostreptococcaceae bacterium]|nr:chromate transporter [Peptostreptococcaceae bacterium]